MKIISSGKVLNSPGFYKKKKIRRRIQFILIFLGFLVFVSSFVFITRREEFLINEVEVLEKNVIEIDEIVRATESMLEGSYLWLIPRRGAFVYPNRAIEKYLLENFPRIESVNFNLFNMRKLTISVVERTPFALYCADASHPAVATECYFLDKEGFIFASAPSFSGVVYFVFATQNPIENPIGQNFVEKEEFLSLTNFIENLSSLNIIPLALGLADDEYDLFLPNGAQIAFKRDGDFVSTYSNLSAFLADESISSQNDFLDRILYMDLRIEDKIRWKFKD